MTNKLINFIPVDELDHNIVETEFNILRNKFVYTNLNNIRCTADTFNMPLVPLEYFDMENALKKEMFVNEVETSIENMQSYIKEQINKFVQYFSEIEANIYLLCPPQFYDIQRHVSSNIDKPIFHNGDNVFITINAMMPFLREINNRINTLEQAQKLSESLINSYGNSRNIQFDDPMLFAIPKNKNIYSDTFAIIGACWGKDIDTNIIKELKLKNINNIKLPIINLPKNQIKEQENIQKKLAEEQENIKILQSNNDYLNLELSKTRKEYQSEIDSLKRYYTDIINNPKNCNDYLRSELLNMQKKCQELLDREKMWDRKKKYISQNYNLPPELLYELFY